MRDCQKHGYFTYDDGRPCPELESASERKGLALIELQRKYDALVERLEHMAEMWDEKDRAAWRTDPSKHLNGFKCADELRALLEDDDA